MTSVPDRPFASLSDDELSARITRNRADQHKVSGQRNEAARAVLRSLKRQLAELIGERNHREVLRDGLPF